MKYGIRDLQAIGSGYMAELALRTRRRLIADDVARGVMVTLTSYPARIDTAWLVIESLFRQSLRPQHLVLVLAESEFPAKALPRTLHHQQERGLQILWVSRDIGSYKKLVPVLSAYPGLVYVTVDDDTLYPRDWLRTLLLHHHRFRGSIIGLRGSRIVLASKTSAAPYFSWPNITAASTGPRLFLKGNGGVLYPPGSLPSLSLDMALAQDLCPTADDIWWKAMALIADTNVRLAGGIEVIPTIRRAQKGALFTHNLTANDTQLQRTFDYFDLWPQLS